MSKIFLVSFIMLLLAGCASLQELNVGSQKDIEATGYVYEKHLAVSYDEAFLAIVDVIHDWGATIFIKDYDKGIISARDFGPNFNIPGKIFGFNLSKVSDTDTKIILKVTRKSYGIDTAAQEDVFYAIEKQILFREKIYQGNKGTALRSF